MQALHKGLLHKGLKLKYVQEYTVSIITLVFSNAFDFEIKLESCELERTHSTDCYNIFLLAKSYARILLSLFM